ncbi:MAG TPA: ATP-dependent helicase [Treponemataceae bacterium]|nr:ATP-dependent helicase [Treponemataceae bacterium]HOS35789.1 ATP-dependent helicase [Treponemataceae bacterium]
MIPETYLSVLNSQQREAVTHEGSPLLILAGAGSGKTRVITNKIAWLIAERGVESESILAVTFTNKAAREMAERARRLEPRSERSVLRTFHSFGAWFLRRNAALAGLDSNFTIYDDDDATTLLGKALPALTRQQVSAIVHRISRAKDYCYGPDDPLLAEIDPNPDFADAYRLYEKRLRETGNVDFGDLILLPVRVMNEHHEVRDRLRSRFSVVMVDEYQDSNVAQFELLRAITGPETYLCVVGDDDQSIYRFRGAEVRNILTFADTFPGTTVIRLEQNYRSKEPILDIASQVVAKNEGRLGKTLVAVRGTGRKPVLVFPGSQDDETAFCAELISNARKQGVPWQDWAILYRTNAQSLGFETEFLHRKIPYKVVGSLKFYEREEIKDALAFLSLVLNGRDEVAFHRIANKPARGLGEVSRNRIIDEYRRDVFYPDSVSTELGFDEHPDIISVAARLLETFSKKARSGLAEFIHVIETMRAMLDEEAGSAADTKAQPAANAGNPAGAERSTAKKPKKGAVGLAVFVDKLIDASGLVAYHRGQDEVAGTQRVANMQELVNAASLYPLSREGLVEFLEHIELDRSMAEDDENPDSVTLITVHNTKGLEFPRVIITGLESGIFPRDDKSGDDLEEERRLMYVGCTRAMDELYLTSCSVRRLYGRTEFMEPSRFLYEIDRDSIEVLGNIPRTFGGGATSSNGATSSAGKMPEDPLAARWKPGRKLYHDDYGYGIISKAFTAGDELVIMVQFENGGEKRFLPKYQAHNLLLVEQD